MAIWLIRAGSHGEYEQKFLDEKRVYVTWAGLNVDISKLQNNDALLSAMQQRYPDAKLNKLKNWVRQVWPFAHSIAKKDLVVLPSKQQPAIYIGEITSDYVFQSNGPDPYFHWREVKWISEAIPRTQFGQDLLHSFGAFLTICRIQRNKAEARINAMRASNWGPDPALKGKVSEDEIEAEDDANEPTNLEDSGRDQIAQLIMANFAGHGLARLVNAILKAQGYTTYLSPEGTDGGIDILAGSNAMGFSSPRIVVQVKSEDKPIGRPEIDQLVGTMDHTKADGALFVAWGGFKSTVYKELSTRFFRVRLWSQKELLEQLFATYDKLDGDLRAELPLKRIWTVAAQDED
ncbi:MAG TPA: restriction endonuclease [Verrucomicrobiae bacterium]|nr:restriction endonuclease [Verrucomicrobiae bacterium]